MKEATYGLSIPAQTRTSAEGDPPVCDSGPYYTKYVVIPKQAMPGTEDADGDPGTAETAVTAARTLVLKFGSLDWSTDYAFLAPAQPAAITPLSQVELGLADAPS